MTFHYVGMILTDLDARSLQLAFSGQAVTATVGWDRGVFVGPYHSCQMSCHVEVTSGGGHGLGQVIRFCCDICKCLHPPVGHLCGQLWYDSDGDNLE